MRGALERWRRAGRWFRAGGARRKLVIFLVLVIGAVALMPLVVAKTSLRNTVLSKAVPSGAVRVSANDASLSWISGPSLSGVAVVDATGGPLIEAERISVDRSAVNLLLNSRDLGLIEIARPTIHVKVRPDGSNLEDALNSIATALSPHREATPASDSAGPPPKFAIHIVEGTILVDDIAASRQWRIEGFNLQYDNRGSMQGLGTASLSGRIVHVAQAAAPVTAGGFSLSLQSVADGRNQLTLQVEGLSLAMAEPWLQRVVVASELGGTLSGQGSASWSNTASGMPSDLVTTGTLSIDRLDATALQLNGDRLQLARIELPWRVASEPTGWNIDDLQLRSDIGRVAVRGLVDPNFAAGRHDLEMRGAVDVAKLAAMLPHAMRIREGTTITSGTIELAGRYQPSEGGQLITGSVRTAQLAATSAGRPLSWDEPVNANFALRRSAGVTQLETLKCDSKFLEIDAAGTPQEFSANASFNLNSLAEQLGQVVDLSDVKLAGTGEARVSWQQVGSDQFSAAANADLTQLAVSLPDGTVWSEPQLEFRAKAAGLLDLVSRRPARVDTAKLQVAGQGDELDVRLTSAVSLASDAPEWPVAIKTSGRIERWLTRVRPWFSPGPWQVDGQSDLSAVVRVSPNSFEAKETTLVVTGLRATSPGWNISEPRVEITGDARWDGATGEVVAESTQLVTSTVSLATRDIRYRAGQQSINQLSGAAAFRTDLTRLAAWRAPADKPAPYQPKGEVTGNLRFAQHADRITGELNATGLNLALSSLNAAASRGVPAPGYQTIWQEPHLTLRGLASYQPSVDRLTFDQFQLQSNTLQATADGAVENLSTAADVNATGTLNYDLAQVTPLLRPYMGNGIQLTGREQARFALAGRLADENGPRAQLASLSPNDPYSAGEPSPSPSLQGRGMGAAHWSRRVRAQLELPWTGANVYGLPVGAGRLAAALGDGMIRIEPLSLAVGEGTLTAAPNVRFDPEPAEITLPPGPLITNVRISPEVSEAMLKYVAPVLAGTTRSEGQFSMQLDGTRVPLADTKKADVAGRLSVHSVRVVPGPMANQLIGVAQQIEALAKRRDPTALATKPQVTLLNIRDQRVNFRVVDGRVHHQNMEFQVGDISMRSQGSVGFDQTVQLTLHVPIQDYWIAKEPLLAGFKGQALQIPVSGTLTRPQIDQRAVASLSQQLLQGAAQQAVGGELNKALDKIFKSR
ncbi:MAG: hypothetical protein L0228_09400 [Planctomycetes bacterium]|nr:hypothetical protein [Planctomycetota bacterium]